MAVDVVVGSIHEKTFCIATVVFTDEDGVAVVPTAVYARIDCATNGDAIRAEAALSSPASSMEISITAAENEIHDEDEPYEIHEVTVRAEYGTGKQVTGSCKYKVLNLEFLS